MREDFPNTFISAQSWARKDLAQIIENRKLWRKSWRKRGKSGLKQPLFCGRIEEALGRNKFMEKEQKFYRNFTLHDLPEEERPRERLQKVGVDNLSLPELLALVIEKGGGRRKCFDYCPKSDFPFWKFS
jgi:hypothetical protein